MKRLQIISYLSALLLLAVAHPVAGTTMERVEPAGLDLTFADDPHPPLELIADRDYYIDSLAIWTEVRGEESEIVGRLMHESAFAELDWDRLRLERRELIPEFDGSVQLQKFYSHARWMGGDHRFTLKLFAADELLYGPLTLTTTDRWPAPVDDPFATRRFSAMVFGHGAEFSAQAAVQLRNGTPGSGAFSIPLRATHLQVEWEQLPGRKWILPLEPVRDSEYDYGFAIRAEAGSPANGSYFAAGETATFRLTFVDGSGRRLHPPGSLPTYAEFIDGRVDSGLQYYAFFPGILYYRDKNREGVLLASLTGPSSQVRQTHEAVPTLEFLTQPIQVAATTATHGFSSQWAMIPPAPIVFGDSGNWGRAVPDRLSFPIPSDALPGRYTFAIKARRLYRGEESLAAAVVEIPVGPTGLDDRETVTPLVGNCEHCHSGDFALSRMLHHIEDLSTCTGCHLPLEFEPNNLLPHRVHRIHNLSDRYQENRRDCTVCHLDPRPTVEDNARWLVCTGCHDPRHAHAGNVPFGELMSCADAICHHTIQRRIHILD